MVTNLVAATLKNPMPFNSKPVEGFTNTYNIKIVGGVSTDRKYLSCGTSWGCSLTSQDDGSGWQHWQLV